MYSPRIGDAGIAIECSRKAYIHISGDIGWIVSVVPVPGSGTSQGVGWGLQGHCVNLVTRFLISNLGLVISD